MRFILLILYFMSAVHTMADGFALSSEDKAWRLERTNFYFEDDIFSQRDNQYSVGWKLSNVYCASGAEVEWLKNPLIDYDDEASFISLGLGQQVYTPRDISKSSLIINDRPYAGWLYGEFGFHQSSPAQLDSLTLQVGVIGKISGAELLQTKFHELIDNDTPKGWDKQLHNELGINLIYEHKWRMVPKRLFGIEGDFIPFVGASLGNVQTGATAGVLTRYGWNSIRDFGASSLIAGGENAIPISPNALRPKDKPWSFTLNFSIAAKAVASNIFLDGNTFECSHSVEKENYVGYLSYGFNARYKNYSIDYLLSTYTKQFRTEETNHSYGSIVFSYLY